MVGRRRAWHAIIALGRQTWSNNVGRGMTSQPLDWTHGRTTSGVACHHRLWAAHTVERRRVWHAVIAFGQYTRSDVVVGGMPSLPMGSTLGRTTSVVACHHCLWEAHTVERRRAWHAIIALCSTHCRATSGVACHHRPWAAHTVGRRQTWHAIIASGQHTRSNDVGRGIRSSPLGSTDGRTTSGVACHHRLWAAHTVGRRRALHAIIALGQHRRSDDVGRGMPSSPLDSTDGRPSSGVTCHHRPWTAQTVERRRACHAIIALGQHTRSDSVERGMLS